MPCHATPERPARQKQALHNFIESLSRKRLLDRVPQSALALGPLGPTWVDAFVEQTRHQPAAPDWTLHAGLWRWLSQHPEAGPRMPLALHTEWLGTLAASWADDQFVDLGRSHIVVLDQASGLAVGAMRPARLDDAIRVVRLGPAPTLCDTPNRLDRLVFGLGRSWSIDTWLPL